MLNLFTEILKLGKKVVNLFASKSRRLTKNVVPMMKLREAKNDDERSGKREMELSIEKIRSMHRFR